MSRSPIRVQRSCSRISLAITAELGLRLWTGKPRRRTSRETHGCCVRSWLMQASSSRSRGSATAWPR
eukprot:10388512-Alexandrium_andersonii.AAC.1